MARDTEYLNGLISNQDNAIYKLANETEKIRRQIEDTELEDQRRLERAR